MPGNHDVSWNAKIGEVTTFSKLAATLGPERAMKDLEGARNGMDSKLRLYFASYGHVELVDLSSSSERFRSVQENFFDKLKKLGGPHCPKSFNLQTEHDDWSAHIFKDVQVAIFGFNSCRYNDKYWHGASIDPRSIARAEQFAKDEAPNMLWLAVWHHGISSEDHRPDHLLLADLERLANAGFRVGFHGHTHRSDQRALKTTFSQPITLLATGSLGAGPNQRPDGVGTEFTEVELFGRKLCVMSYVRTASMGFTLVPRMYVEQLDEPPVSGPKVRVREHNRSYSIGPQGIATVSVSLVGIRGNGRVVAAQLVPPLSRARLLGNGASSFDLPNGSIQYSLDYKEGKTAHLRYEVANAFATTQSDLKLRLDRQGIREQLGIDDFEMRPHCVRVACSELTLTIDFASDVLDQGTVSAAVSEQNLETGEFKPVEKEARRCKLVVNTPRSVSLRVQGPILGKYYGVKYKPLEKGVPITSEADRLCGWIGDKFRGARGDTAAGVSRFTRRLGQHIREECCAAPKGKSPSEFLQYSGLLWSPERRVLTPTFGDLENSKWGLCFSSGHGVAGHAFRFAAVAYWHKSREADQLIYVEIQGDVAQGQHEWLICVPILLTPKGAPIGVVTLEPTGRCDQLEKLDAFAKGQLQLEETRELTEKLARGVNVSFWDVLCREGEILARDILGLAKDSLDSWTEHG